MVFESVLTDLLNRFLKPYVKKLDTSQLKLGIWGGNVTLGKLELKDDLFDELGLPIKIKRSYIGDIKMKIPWKSLSKDPIIVKISEIYVIVSPSFDRPYDEERHVKMNKLEKEKAIAKIEEAAKKMKQKAKERAKGKGREEKDPDKPDTFTEKLAAHLMKNLTVTVDTIHVRYEDTVTNPGSTIALGATLDSLKLESTDANWQACVVKETAALIYKLVELNSLAVYWNTYAQTLADLPGDTEWMIALKEQIARNGEDLPSINTYALRPISASVKLKLNLKPTANLSIPQLFGNFECEDIDISLREDQFKSLMLILDGFSRYKLNEKYLKYKPVKQLKDDKRGWWQYAYRSVLEEDVKRRLYMWSWKRMKKHRNTCRLYTEKYYDKISSKTSSSSLNKQLEALENELDVFNIMVCRKQAKRRKKKIPVATPIVATPTVVKPTPSVPMSTPSVTTPTVAKPTPSVATPTVVKPTPSVATPTGAKPTVVKPTPSVATPTVVKPTPSVATPTGAKPTPSVATPSVVKPTPSVATPTVTKPTPSVATPTVTKPTPSVATPKSSPEPVVSSKVKEQKKPGGFFSRFKKKLKEPDKHEATPTEATPTDSIATAVEPPPPGVDLQEKEEERERYFREIGYTEEDEYVEFPPEYVAHHITASIKCIRLHLLDKQRKLLTVTTNGVSVCVRNRPTNTSTSVSANVGGVTVMGIPRDNRDTVMVSSVPKMGEGLLDFSLEINPLDRSNMDMVVMTTVNPLKIVYDEDTIDGIIAAFRVKKNVHLMELTSAASSTLQELQSRTSSELQTAIQFRKQLEVDVTIHSPYIILPENGFYSDDHRLIVVDFGSLSIKGSTKDPKDIVKGQQALTNYYDSFFIELQDLQVMIVKPGDDWATARTNGHSKLHVMNKTGLGIELKKSIVSDDALLPSLQIIGDFPGFKIDINDDKLRTVLKIVTSLNLPPPALRNTTTYYNELPPPPSVSSRQLSDIPYDIARTMSVDTLYSQEDEDDYRTMSPTSSIGTMLSDDGSADNASHFVFTDVKMNFKIHKIEVTLNQYNAVNDKETNLLTVSLNGLQAEVFDRNWDLQGSVSIQDLIVCDYITRDASGQPSYLVKTDSLVDGNFISARFVKITAVGREFADKYTGLTDSASVQLSLVHVHVQQVTASKLIQFGLSLKPALEKPVVATDETIATRKTRKEPDQPSQLDTPTADVVTTPSNDFVLKASFDGIDFKLSSTHHPILQAQVSGFSVDADLKANDKSVVASMKDLVVSNLVPGGIDRIVHKANTTEDIVRIEFHYYPNATKGANIHNLELVDASVDAKIQRIMTHLDTQFINNILLFAMELKVEAERTLVTLPVTIGPTTTGAMDTAIATAGVVKDSSIGSFRVKLDVSLLAPLIHLPFTSRRSTGTVCVSLGDFKLSNRFIHGYETHDTRGTTISLYTAHAILDRIELHSSNISVYLETSRVGGALHVGGTKPLIRSDIIDDMCFDVVITRNLSRGHSHFFPDVKVQLTVEDQVKFRVSDNDIECLFAIALLFSKMADSLPSSSTKPTRHHKSSSRPRTLSQANKSTPASRLQSFDPDQVIKMQVDIQLNSVVLELFRKEKQIISTEITDVSSTIKLTEAKLLIRAQIISCCVTELQTIPGQYNIVLRFDDKKKTSYKAVFVEVEVPLDTPTTKEIRPLALIKVSVGQLQLYLPSSFLRTILDFVLSIDINPGLVKKATKAAQDGAIAAKDLVQDVYVKLDVSLRAPTIFLPPPNVFSSAIMIDMGHVQLQNEANRIQEDLVIDQFSLTLAQFKISRVLIECDPSKGVCVTSERMLVQPYSMIVNLQRSLCPWNRVLPAIDLDVNMGVFKINLGEEDVSFIGRFVMSMVEDIGPLLSKKGKKQIKLAGAVVEGLTEGTEGEEEGGEEVPVEEEVYKKICLSVALSEFMIKLFTEDTSKDPGSIKQLSDERGMASFQVIAAAIKVAVFSNSDVELCASISDMAITDLQAEHSGNKIGTRVLQHFTSNPLEAFTGKISQPMLGLDYYLKSSEHSLLVKGQNILLLSNVGFMQSVADYFKRIAEDVKRPEFNDIDSIDSPDSSISSSSTDTPAIIKKDMNIPAIKLDLHFKDLRIALVESLNEKEPQALILKVSMHTLFRVDPVNNTKQASLTVADLRVITSSYYDLETATSVVLFPTSFSVTMTGPLDKLTAMDINGTMDSISLKLSPAIVRLIIHAVKTLSLNATKPSPPPAPSDIWKKQNILSSQLWFLSPLPLHNVPSEDQVSLSSRDEDIMETFTLTVEGIEVIFETEPTDVSAGLPVISCNVRSVVQAFDWSGKFTCTVDAQAEASYFNTSLSVWEPLLEPLVMTNGSLKPWSIQAEMSRNPKPVSNETSIVPEFQLSLKATDPLQLTLSKSSITIIKDLAENCLREYGKKVEGSVNISTLTGAPFTISNELGMSVTVFLPPGESLKLKSNEDAVDVSPGGHVDVYYRKLRGHASYASLVSQSVKEQHSIDLSIGKEYQNLSCIPLDAPGSFYYPIKARAELLGPAVAIVVDIQVTGAKKQVTIRSPLQVHNHTDKPFELLSKLPMSSPTMESVITPGSVYSVPFGTTFTADFSVRPKDLGLEASVPSLVWQKLKSISEQSIDLSCQLQGYDAASFHIKAIAEEQSYTIEKHLPDGIYAHHTFHLYPPLVLQNLLPVKISVEAEDGSIHPFTLEPGETREMYLLDLTQSHWLFINLPDEELCGRVNLPSELPKEMTFLIGKDRDTVLLSVLHEDLGYHRLSVYCPFWMVNKTGIKVAYKDDKSGRVYKQVPNKNIVLLSCQDKKSPKIRLKCYTPLSGHTEYSKTFSLQAVGTSGCVTSKLSDTCIYHFGVSVELSKFTLSKLVVVTPYYMIANQTNFPIQVIEDTSPAEATCVTPGSLSSFWPITRSNKLSLAINGSTTTVFTYNTTDSLVLNVDREPYVLCVEVLETGGSNVITVSPYYEGCAPVLIMNLLPSIMLMYKQDREGTPTFYLSPGESIHYTWEDPCAKRELKWGLKGIKMSSKHIDITKDGKGSFPITPAAHGSASGHGSIVASTTPTSNDSWLSVSTDNNLTESLVSVDDTRSGGVAITRGHWISFLDGLQRVLVFTHDNGIVDRLKAVDQVARNKIELSLAMRSIGISLVDNSRKREVAYIGVTQSGVIWQVARNKGHWKTLNNSLIALLEEAHQNKSSDIRTKDVVANLTNMEMFAPLKGSLRRTNYEGVELTASMSENEYSLHAKIGYVQIDNQLPFAIYPQIFYPLPPPPTVASTVEPKPFVEASLIIRKTEQKNVNHFKYVHVLVQKMAVNADLGFILALIDIMKGNSAEGLLEAQYVLNDIEYTGKTMQEIALPAASDEAVKRNFFDVFHLSPIKITLSFSVGHKKFEEGHDHAEERFVKLFLHSVGAILTSIQEAQMNFSLFHLEYIAVTWSKLVDLFVKHYRTQGLVQIHTIVLGLDVLGNPVNVVRGVVSGTFDLFYEPIKGSVLGPEDFAEGLGIGLKSFFGGTVGGLTGAGARITGTVGDVFAKLSFDSQFMDKRQQDKVKSTGKIGSKFGGFFKNVAEGVTGVVVQPIKGVKEEGALGFFKGTGIGLVGLLVRPTGGLIDLTSGALDFVTRKTKVGNVDIVQIRPPRFIGRDGLITPYYPQKALGSALLQNTDEGVYTSHCNKKDDFYVDHLEISKKPLKFIIATDRQMMVIEQSPLINGWKSSQQVKYKFFKGPCTVNGHTVTLLLHKQAKNGQIVLSTNDLAQDASRVINHGFTTYQDVFAK